MNRPELGRKYSCVGCGARFYDLNRAPAVCPKCEAHQPPEKPRAVRATATGGFGRRFGAYQPPPIAHEQAEPVAASDDDAADADDADDEDAAETDDEVDELPDLGERAL